MARLPFSAKWVASVKPPQNGQIDYFDTSPPRIGLRVAPGGRKTWFIMYRIDGRLRRYTLGVYPDLSLAEARRQAAFARNAIAKGDDPAAQKQRDRRGPSVTDLSGLYIERYARVQKKTWRDDVRLLEREILPAWGSRKAQSITRADVLALLDRIVERGAPIQANRILALVRKMFNWAISRDLVVHNPCLQIKAPGKEHQRDRVLNEEEIRAIWMACMQTDDTSLGALIQLQLLTAQRGSEVRQMRWEDIDLDWWTIPASMTKNNLAHRVPLSTPVKEILRRMQAPPNQGVWVFQSPKFKARPRSRPGVQKKVQEIRDRSGVSLIPHDLRRTAASHMTGMGISRLVVSKILNHVESGVTRVYDRHSYDGEKRQALEAWGRKVMTLIGEGEPGKVIPLRREVGE